MLFRSTRTGYSESSPHFVLDGNAIIYFTEKYGLRAQASWGSQDDIMIVFLNREARDRFNLSKEDYALLKEAEKKSKADKPDAGKEKSNKKKDDSKKAGKDDGKDDGKADAADKKKKEITVELDGIEDRVMRLTPFSSSLSDAFITADGEDLYFLSSFDKGYDLWKMPLRDGDPSLASKLGAAPSWFTDRKSTRLNSSHWS